MVTSGDDSTLPGGVAAPAGRAVAAARCGVWKTRVGVGRQPAAVAGQTP